MQSATTLWCPRIACALTLLFTLSACGGGGGGNRNDGDAALPVGNGVPEFSAASFTVDESAGTATITIGRFGPAGNAIASGFTIESSNGAVEGSDYTIASKQVMFAAGDTTPKTITVNITNDQFDESDEVLTLRLMQSASNNVNGNATASRVSATLTIRDDDTVSSAQFVTDSYSVNEDSGTALVTLQRFGTAMDAITAVVTATGGTASAGQDYSSTTAQVVFPAGDASAQVVAFSIVNDLATESTESITLSLAVTAGSGEVPPQERGQSATIAIADDDDASRVNPALTLSSVGPKTVVLDFDPVPGARRYQLRRGRLAQDFQQVGADLPDSASQVRAVFPVHLSEVFRLDPCDAIQCRPSQALRAPGLRGSFAATGYLKASDTRANQQLGSAVAVSADGSTVALGAADADNDAGAVYLYRKPADGSSVLSSRPIKIAAPTTSPIRFGTSIALNSSGTMLLVGAPADDNTARPAGSDRYPPANLENRAAAGSGGAFLYQLPTQDLDSLPAQPSLEYRYLKAPTPLAGDAYGSAVAITPEASGRLSLAIGAPGDDSGNATDSGAVYLSRFLEDGPLLVNTRLKASDGSLADVQAGARFGAAVASGLNPPPFDRLERLVVGAPGYRVSAPSGGDVSSGAAYVFSVLNTIVGESSAFRVESPAPGTQDEFGSAVAISADASTILVGAPGADVRFSVGNQMDRGSNAGAAFVFRASGGRTQRPAFFTSQPAGAGTRFGTSVAVSADGSIIAVGVPRDNERAFGVTAVPSQRDDQEMQAGAVSVLRRLEADWRSFTDPRGLQPITNYVKASNVEAGDLFGSALALSSDAQTLVVGAPGEDGNGTNFDAALKPFDANNNQLVIDAKQSDNSATRAGAAYLY